MGPRPLLAFQSHFTIQLNSPTAACADYKGMAAMYVQIIFVLNLEHEQASWDSVVVKHVDEHCCNVNNWVYLVCRQAQLETRY